jgi:CheY-like chemotaxis protein
MRYELADHEWTAIRPMLPNKPRGVPRVNDRRVLNGICGVLRSGAPWRDLPMPSVRTPPATTASFAGGGLASGAASWTRCPPPMMPALAAVKQQPDLILMDIQIPIIDGYEVTRRLKADPNLEAIPIIAVTSHALSESEAKARAAGCNDSVAKPYSPRQLLTKIRQYLS